MTAGQLKHIIASLPEDMLVCYNYDTGHSYPEINHAFVATVPEFGNSGGVRALILDENPPDTYDLPDAAPLVAVST